MNADPEALDLRQLQGRGVPPPRAPRPAVRRKVIVVIEKLSELPQLLKLGEEMGVEPMIRLRSKLSTCEGTPGK